MAGSFHFTNDLEVYPMSSQMAGFLSLRSERTSCLLGGGDTRLKTWWQLQEEEQGGFWYTPERMESSVGAGCVAGEKDPTGYAFRRQNRQD